MVFACIIDLLVPQACKMGVPVGPVSQMRIATPGGPVARRRGVWGVSEPGPS